MAARQDQTLQIALIVFAILLVIFAGFTYWFYKQSSDAQQQLAAQQTELNTANTAVRNKEAEAESLRQWMGYEQFAQKEDVEKQLKEDMGRMGGILPEPKRNYRDVLLAIYAGREASVAASAVDKDTINGLQRKLAELEAGHQAQVKQYEKNITEIEQKAAADRNQFTQARAELDKAKTDLAEQLNKKTEDFDKEQARLQTDVEKWVAEADKRQRALDKQLELRKQEDFSFEVADGQVKWVNQANSTVWIDLGAADSLRRQVTFSVFDTDATDAGKAEKKGSVEVVRMLGPHMAECRVTDDDPKNPISRGDYIYSQVWHAGKPQHFALTGIIDLDGDSRSDIQLAKNLIALNGGVVDAAPDAEGNLEGEMTVETRYMVLGEFPESGEQQALRDTWAKMGDEAKALGVETITLTDFMNQMGYKPEDRTVPLGSGSRAEDFRPRPNSDRSSLRPRSPYDSP